MSLYTYAMLATKDQSFSLGVRLMKSASIITKATEFRLQGKYYVGCSQNYRPLCAIDYTTAPNIKGYQNGTLILGNYPMYSGI